MSIEIPKGATHEVAGMYFKYGVHNKIYYWSDAARQWLKSDRKVLVNSFDLTNPHRIKYGLEPWLRGDYA